MIEDGLAHSPAAERNRAPIGEVIVDRDGDILLVEKECISVVFQIVHCFLCSLLGCFLIWVEFDRQADQGSR